MLSEYLKIDNQLCFRLYSTSRKMTRLYQPFLEKFKLTYPQYIVMLVMFEHREIDFKDLSNIVDLKTGTLTPIIQKLVSIGYLDKVKNTNDSRKINISLTETGILLEKAILEVPIGLGNKLEISEEMYIKLSKELDDLTLLLKNATIKEEN